MVASARARPEEERARTGAGESGRDRRDLAAAVTRAGRRVQLLDVSSFRHDVPNELSRLRGHQGRLKRKEQRSQGAGPGVETWSFEGAAGRVVNVTAGADTFLTLSSCRRRGAEFGRVLGDGNETDVWVSTASRGRWSG